MEIYSVRSVPPAGGAQIAVTVPGSKSITNRALLMAALASGTSVLDGVLFSDDSRHFLACMEALGIDVKIEEEKKRVSVKGCAGILPNKKASLYVGSAGTAARFLTALLGLSEGEYILESSDQMRRRPIKPLLDTLTDIGADVQCLGEADCFPFILRGSAGMKREMTVNIDASSQFLSALLIACAGLGRETRIHVTGSHGMAYVDMTARMLERFGARVMGLEDGFLIPGGAGLLAMNGFVEPDVSGAAYFYAAAAVTGAGVTVRGVHMDSLQGDTAFLRVLESMGCLSEETEEGVRLTGPSDGRLKGISVDMHAFSDQAVTLAAIAPFADSPVEIRGISHIRLQESDRIAGILENLRRMKIRCEELPDGSGIRIYPGVPAPASIATFQDHRMAMAFAVTGLRCPGILIEDPLCCRKTFEDYFECFDRMTDQLLSRA